MFLGLFVFKTFLGGHPQAFVRGHLGHVLPRALIGGPGAPTLWGEVAPPLKRLGMATPQRQRHNQPHGRFGHVTFTEFPSRPEPPAALPALPGPLGSGGVRQSRQCEESSVSSIRVLSGPASVCREVRRPPVPASRPAAPSATRAGRRTPAHTLALPGSPGSVCEAQKDFPENFDVLCKHVYLSHWELTQGISDQPVFRFRAWLQNLN